MGGARAGFFTGWLNLIGLIAVTASVAYGCATFIDLTLSTFSTSYAGGYSLTRVFLIFLVVLALAAILNIFSGHLMAIMNNVSVWWHVFGAALIIAILIIVPDHHQSFSYVFTERFNNSGYSGGSTDTAKYWFLVLPLGLLLTQYTITGFDASAHLSEETASATKAAARGIWQSIFYSAIGGWILLLCFLFAVPNGDDGKPDNAGVGGGGVAYIFTHAMNDVGVVILFISAAGQFFCTTACMTSASRMTFAFSRDGAYPALGSGPSCPPARCPAWPCFWPPWSARSSPLPALKQVNLGTEAEPLIVPVAFYAVVSVAVIGLYLAFLIPIWLRWRMGDAFRPGSWNNGAKYKWMNLIAVIEIAIICIYFILPFVPAAVPGSQDFHWKFVNYAPILTLGSLIVLAIWWQVSARKWFTGPKTTLDGALADMGEQWRDGH
jgi:amino acid transporter